VKLPRFVFPKVGSRFWQDYSVHLAVAILGSLAGGAIVGATLALLQSSLLEASNAVSVHRVLLHRPFPLQLSSACILGFLAPGYTRSPRLAFWTWVPTSLVLVVRMLYWMPGSVLNSESTFDHFFGPCPQRYCSDQFTVTLPFYVSLAYSAAAIIAYRRKRQSPTTAE
jgi:hypothetical protein